jgi:hypothetical protein
MAAYSKVLPYRNYARRNVELWEKLVSARLVMPCGMLRRDASEQRHRGKWKVASKGKHAGQGTCVNRVYHDCFVELLSRDGAFWFCVSAPLLNRCRLALEDFTVHARGGSPEYMYSMSTGMKIM